METFRTLSGKIFKGKLAALIVVSAAIVISCGPKSGPQSIADSVQIDGSLVFEALEKTFGLIGFSADLTIERTGFEMYPDVKMYYSVRFQFPDRVHLKPKYISEGQFSDEVIALGSREYHFTSEKWEEYPRTDMSDIYFQTDLVLMDSNFVYLPEKSDGARTYFFAFKPNLPLFDPLGKIITTGEIIIDAKDTLIRSVKVFSPDSSFLWSFEITGVGISGEIRAPSLFYYFFKVEIDSIRDTLAISSRLSNCGCAEIKISSFRRSSEIEFMSERESPFMRDLLTAEGYWEIREVMWIHDDPGKYINDSVLLREEFGSDSRIGFIAGIPYKPAILLKPVLDCRKDVIMESGVSYSAIDRISLKILFSEESGEKIRRLPEGTAIGLVVDGSLVAVADSRTADGSYSFIWERGGNFDIDFIRSVLNSPFLSGQVKIKD